LRARQHLKAGQHDDAITDRTLAMRMRKDVAQIARAHLEHLPDGTGNEQRYWVLATRGKPRRAPATRWRWGAARATRGHLPSPIPRESRPAPNLKRVRDNVGQPCKLASIVDRPRRLHRAPNAWPWTLAALCLALWAVPVRPGVAAEPLRQAPPLTATLLDGRAFTLEHRAGKVLILNFWATWCAPCREEMPALEAFRSKYQGRGLEVLAISLDDARQLPAVRAALRGFGFDAALAGQASYDGYGRIWRLPTTFVIDRDGRLRNDLPAGPAPLDLAWLERHVAPLLGA
jgi:thiol-disulfide isomerase/thioredoxin